MSRAAKKAKARGSDNKKKKTNDQKPSSSPPAAAEVRASSKRITEIERDETHMLSCTLTEREVNSYAHEGARLHRDIASLKKEAKDAASSFKARIEALNTRLDEVTRKIENGREDREVRCKLTFHYDKGVKTLTRLDDNTEVSTFVLTDAERQMRLPLKETKDDRVTKTEDVDKEKKSEAQPPVDIAVPEGGVPASELPAELPTVETPRPGDLTGTDEVRTPAAESELEQKIRVWWNSFSGKTQRKQALSIVTETADNSELLALSYKKLSDDMKSIVRNAYQAHKSQQQQS